MKKADKKIDNQICKALTKVCETVKVEVQGFQWLTHFVDYNEFPDSLLIICIFSTKFELEHARQEMKGQMIVNLIKTEFKNISINLNDTSRHVSFDTEGTFKNKRF